MVYIRELCIEDKGYIKAIAMLHKKAFPSFFLTQLGITFLRVLYCGYLEDRDSGIIIAEEDEEVIGFIAYSKDYSLFYKRLMKKHFLKFALSSAGASLRHPSFSRRLLGAFTKSKSVVKKEKYVELASICVDPEYQGRGIGSSLVSCLKTMVDYEVYAYINLETDAEDNERVNNFYKKNGFSLAGNYTTREGRKMNEYRYYDYN